MPMQEIRLQVEELVLDRPEVVDTFSRRLARENGWSHQYTARVVKEYRRFLILAASADAIVAPSDAVDQAWHLHLLQTRDYLRTCERLFGRVVEHSPSEGGPAERAKFETAYARTLGRYKAEFDEDPPNEIWPSPEQRLHTRVEFVRLDRQLHWVLAKPQLLRTIGAQLQAHAMQPSKVAVACTVAVILTGCALRSSMPQPTGPEFLIGLCFAWLISLLLAILAKLSEQSSKATASESLDLDAYEMAYLAGDSRGAIDAGIAVLVARGAASFDAAAGALKASTPELSDACLFERRLHALLSNETPLTLTHLRERATEMTSAMGERLERLGLALRKPSKLPFLLMLVAPVIAAVRIVSRIGTDRPVGGLVAILVFGVVFAMVAFHPSRFRTWRGEDLLNELRDKHAALAKEPPTEFLALGVLPVAIGLFGLGVTSKIPLLNGLQSSLQGTAASGGGGSDCGSCGGGSDCGGGCGGGCGGCGGCGG
jgi:uncharacterized protein (TIGR04222 family)